MKVVGSAALRANSWGAAVLVAKPNKTVTQTPGVAEESHWRPGDPALIL